MKARSGHLILAVMIVICLQQGVYAGSIWAKRGRNMKKIYADDTARQIGDILTITIAEKSNTTSTIKRELNKTTEHSIGFSGEVGKFADVGDFGFTAASENDLTGKTKLTDARDFVDDITVQVVDIMPNGNLVVYGTREREISGDTQVIEVSGIVRPSDIPFTNIIKSDRVADFKIINKTGGISDIYNKPGWFGTILNIIWPF